MLFSRAEDALWLPSEDPRARHVRTVLRLRPGDPFYVGVARGPRGQASIVEDTPAGLRLRVNWEAVTEPPRPLRLLVGLPRPQTARRVLFESACLGIEALHFFRPEKGEPSYADSKLWSDGSWETYLWQGAEQAFATWLPGVTHHLSLADALGSFGDTPARLALDVYEGEGPLSALAGSTSGPVALALGPERGWSAGERDALRGAGWRLASLGSRVLRLESACIAAVSVVLAGRGEF